MVQMPGSSVPPAIDTFVAIGDSFTEGLNDPAPGGGFRGWADLVAGALSAQRPGFRYANLAIRGKLLGQVVTERVPRAVELAPDLVSLAAGGNDILCGTSVDELAATFEPAVAKLQAAGCRVLIFTGFDPRMFPVIRLLRGRIAAYNMHLRGIADEHGCDLVDLWSMRALKDARAWSPDRLHLTTEGHRQVARRACEVLGIPAGAEAEEIKKAYFTAAKRFHSDSFSGLELGSARKAAEELFAKVNEAYSALSDKEKRAEHDVFLDRKAKGLPTDVGAILRAEGIFQKGELFFNKGRWEDAEAQFREAIGLNHAEAEFHAFLGMAIFKRTGKAPDGLPHLEKALEMEPRLRSGTLFAAQIYEAAGENEKAKTVLRKALDKDAEFNQAKDELRRLKNKPAEQKGGFFSRLLKK